MKDNLFRKFVWNNPLWKFKKKSELMERLANVQSPAVLEEIEKILNEDENIKFNFQEE